MKKALILFLFLLFFGCCKVSDDTYVTLHIFHTNDLHSHLKEFDLNGVDCQKNNATCLGGFARIKTLHDTLKAQYPDLISFDAGDRFSGTAFYALNKSRDLIETLNPFNYDAMALGNHEFDDGLSELSFFVSHIRTPIVAGNVIFPEESSLSSNVKSFIVIERNNVKIGVAGLLTQEVKTTSSNIKDIDILPIIQTAEEQVSELKRLGVKYIIFLTHIGLEEDKKLAAAVSGIDVIIGAHSHSLLSNKSEEISAEGPYPVVISGPDGKNVLIVSTGFGGPHVGFLNVVFNEQGDVVSWQGDTIPVSQDISEDAQIKAYIQKSENMLEERLREKITVLPFPVGLTPGKSFCSESCFAGEVLADLFLRSEERAEIAFVNGGGIRGGLPKGDVSFEDVINTFPFDSDAVLTRLTGREILFYLTHGLENYVSDQRTNEFLHPAGLSYVFSSEHKTILDVSIAGCPLDPEKEYDVLIPAFIAEGGDGYPVVRNGVYLKKSVQESILNEMRKGFSAKFEGRVLRK